MARFIDVMNGTWGRVARVVVGLGLIALGLIILGVIGIVLIAIGVVLFGFALSGHCVLELLVRSQPRHPHGLGQ
jgi:ABC-type uncharacterized transport system permease subunit